MGVNARNGRFTPENGRFAHRAAFRRLWSLLALCSAEYFPHFPLAIACMLFKVPLRIGFFFLRPYEESAWAVFYRDITAPSAAPEENF